MPRPRTEPQRAAVRCQAPTRAETAICPGSFALVRSCAVETPQPTRRAAPSFPLGCCHTIATLVGSDNDDCPFAGLFYGRYWARTSDPQLVELVLSQLS